MRLLTTGRAHFGWSLLLLAALVWGGMHVYLAVAPAPTQQEVHKGADIYYAAARPAVWWADDCVDLTWQLSGITEVYINDVATVGEATEAWCLPPPAEYRGFYRDPARPELRVRFADGEIRRYNVPIYVMQPFLLRIVLPLALMGVLALASVYLPPAATHKLTQPRPLPARWQVRLDAINWRRVLGWLMLTLAGVTLLAIGYRVTFAPAYTEAMPAGDATLDVTIDPPVVFWSDGCTTLAWAAQNIQSLSLEGEAVPNTGEQAWCLPPRSSNSIYQFELVTDAGDTHRRTVYVRALQPVLYYTVLPALLLAVYLFKLHHRVLPAPLLDVTRYANHQLLKPFYMGERLHRPLLVLFLLVNALALSNLVRHNATLAYDAEDHFLYSLILSQGRLPTEAETNQFFAPPLVYVFPALVHTAATSAGMEPCTAHAGEQPSCRVLAKAAQLQNGVAVVGITYLLVLCAGTIRPQDAALKFHALALLGTLPVFYKSMVFHRGEPFVALFTLLVYHRLLIMLPRERRPTRTDVLILGLGLGLLLISRQWGVFAALGVSVWALVAVLKRGRAGVPLLRAGLTSYLVMLLSGGWFYLFTRWRLGAVTAFNRSPEGADSLLAVKPLEFYIGLGSGTLFSEPFRSARIAQIVPIFYTEMWGDYWGHFHLPSADFSVWTATPPALPLSYMAQVNVVSLVPTVLLLVAAGFGVVQLYTWLSVRAYDLPRAAYALCQLIIIASYAGYLWFLVRYPHSVGDTIKATYALHTFPLLALLGGAVLLNLRRWNTVFYGVVVLLLALVALHNLPMLVTQYTGHGM